MSQARIKARRLTEEAEMLRAAADLQEELADAKDAHTADPTPETYAAKQAAMAKTAEWRSVVRGIARLRKVRQKLTDPGLTPAKREAYEAELPGLEERWAQIDADLEEMRASAGPVPLPEGSAEAYPEPARLRGKVSKVGGA